MFSLWESFSAYIIFELLGFDRVSHLGEALHFFLFDTIKIFILLIAIVYAVTLLRSYFPIERVRDYISGKNKIVGHIFAALFGMLTPFCSCSAIPLFLGFLQARIPLGVTFSYLISAPLSDAVVIALLFSLFGLKITLLYIGFSLSIAIVVGLIIGSMNLEKEVLLEVKAACCSSAKEASNQTLFKLKMSEAWNDTMDIFKKIYIYVIVGIAIGAFIHGYVPTDFITKYAGGDVWYAPIVAVVMGIPMYSSAAGMLPLVEVLTQKGMLLGTALSFMMAVVALSLPEAMILKRVLSTKLIVIFFTTVGSAILFVGFIFNIIL
ncbi:MAG: permease [Sulfurimonas sp.]|uniref:permease n=1 Tax=Sulfurimonas sp. TaxID=2022749 RepID=UPI0025CF054E|nr:permease [Sulfurimonas sp.]MCK9491069.1 permease [Sulfurimonas sp.]